MPSSTLERAAQLRVVEARISRGELSQLGAVLPQLHVHDLVDIAERLTRRDLAVLFRLLPKSRAVEFFDALPPALQSDVIAGLQDDDTRELFAALDPDDRVSLLDEVPAVVATRLMRDLSPAQRKQTSMILGYPEDSVGRRMSPQVVTTHPDLTVEQTMQRVREHLDDAETVYTIPVLDHGRRVEGVVSLRDLLGADPSALIRDTMEQARVVDAAADVETAARDCVEQAQTAVPVVDSEQRLVGIFTLDDAAILLQEEADEDHARQGGVEPLRRPYLSTPVLRLVRSRIVWLLVLAVGAMLTVQVLDIFESTLAKVTVLALFVPLLIGTGGNTGNQAATTVTRALALDEVRPRDLVRVVGRELRVGATLGLVLGSAGFLLAGAVYGWSIGIVIGLTLLSICTVAASVGGAMPIIAKTVGADPAVFSNPFISTFVDASGLIIYFMIAKTVLGI